MLSSFALATSLLAQQESELTTGGIVAIVLVLTVLFGLLIFSVVVLSYARWWIQSLFSKAGG